MSGFRDECEHGRDEMTERCYFCKPVDNKPRPYDHRAYFTCYFNARPFLYMLSNSKYTKRYQGGFFNGRYVVYWW